MKELNSMIKILNNEKDLKSGFALRKEVFVKEQNVPLEIEIDEKDYLSIVPFISVTTIMKNLLVSLILPI